MILPKIYGKIILCGRLNSIICLAVAVVHRRFFNVAYTMNMLFQGIFSLLTPIGFALLISWLLVERAGAPSWLYAPLVILGVFSGFYSMVRFIIAAGNSLERLEREQNKKYRKRNNSSGNDK